MYSHDYFDITTLSGNTLRISCTGCGVGPKVTMNPDLVNFHDSPAGTTVTRALFIHNNTNVPAFYQVIYYHCIFVVCFLFVSNSLIALIYIYIL